MERTRNSSLQQKNHLRIWLDRSLAAGTIMASGHICWGKVAKGLTGRLGEFAAHYTGPAPGRGHQIIVRNGTGAVATVA